MSALVREGADQDTILAAVAGAIASALGVETVVVNVYSPADDDFFVAEVHGSADARGTLLGSRYSSETWQQLLDARFARRGAYVLLHGSFDWDGSEGSRYVPALEPAPSDPDAWHPEDEIFVPIRGADGETLAVISIGDPVSGRRPDDADLDVLVALSTQAGIALQQRREGEAALLQQRALEELYAVSARLNERLPIDSVLHEICAGAARGLGFGKVSIHLADEEGGHFLVRAAHGYEPGHALLTTRFPVEDVDRLLDPAFGEAGCHLLPYDAGAERPSAETHVYASESNGSGPKAWNRHRLLAPIVGADNTTRGILWADDPADRLLPSAAQLRVLRMFANQAATAIDVADQFGALERHGAELQSLHETTLTLVDELDLDTVLDSIVARAATLLSTPHAFLYLVDADGETMTARVNHGMFSDVGSERRRRGQGISGRVWDSGESQIVVDYGAWSGRVEAYANLGTVVAAPLRGRAGVVGVLGLAFDRGSAAAGRAGVEQLERYAQLASLALENARLFTAAQRDLADRRAAEDALARSRRLYRSVVESSPDLMALTSRSGEFLYVSPQHRTLLGVEPHQLEGEHSGALVHPDDRQALASARVAAVAEGSGHAECVRIHSTRGWLPFEITFVRIPGTEGDDEPFLLSTGRDISARVRADAERTELEDQLRHSQKMEAVGRLAGGIAHDFNNLLTGINGYASLVLTKLEDETLVQQVQQISLAGERAADLTRQLLAFSRKQVLQPELLDVNDAIRSLESLMRPLLGARIALRHRLDPAIGLVRADPGQLEQVLMNLCVNARDSMPDGGLLEVETSRVERSGRRLVELVVRDGGCGIPEELRSRIFEPFFTTKGVGEGTGLGLSTVLGIIEQTGGTVEVESDEGGTAFHVFLPELPRVALAPVVEETPPPTLAGRETILVVEDEDGVRRLAVDVLADLGYVVLEAARPEVAFALARDHHGSIDVVLSDVVMPAESGPALVARIATLRPDAAVVFMSGYPADELPAAGSAALGASFLQKPFTREQLVERVRSALDTRRAA